MHRVGVVAAGVALGFLFAGAGSARADTVVLEPVADTTLYAEDGDGSNGTGAYLFVGLTNDDFARRALLRFDLSSIPAGSTITSATLSLYMSRAKNGSARNVSLHRVTSSWGEAGSQAAGEEGVAAMALAGDATWTYALYPTVLWTDAGGDFVTTPSATTSVAGEGLRYAWTSAQMVADVQAWLGAPGSTYGWILIGDEATTRSAKRFDSRDQTDTTRRPRLTIEYSLPGACCDGGSCSLVPDPGSTCAGTYLGAATLCSPNPCTVPSGACCAVDGSCSIVDAPGGSCAGTYRGDGSTCSPNDCPQPTGACCDPDGSCTELTNAACAGIYQGDASLCAPNPCPQPTGACCAPDGSCTEGEASSCAETYVGDGSSCGSTACPLVLAPYVDALPRPGVAVPTSGASGAAADYAIAIRQIQQRLHRDLPETTVWVYDDGSGGSFPGPTIEARTGEPVRVTWTNDLRDAGGALRTDHILPVDECPHGAGRGPTRVVTHLHGGHVPAEFDGHPDETITPGESVTYEYPNWQDASTIWYHDHALGITRLNVYAGLAALYVIRDDAEDALGLPSGDYEVPLVIQDRSFHPDGSLRYPETWQEHFFGDVNLVNGKVMPYLEVDRGLYRFRIVNGANARTYTLSLSGGLAFTVIGVDGGLLDEPRTVSQLTLGGAERADVLVDFSELDPGTEVLLTNSAPAPFPGTPGVGVLPEVMQLRVTDQVGHTGAVPSTLRALETLDEADSIIERDFELRRDGGDECGGRAWLINGLGWDDITEEPTLGTTEVWRFINRSGVTHPMHMHLVFFQVLDRQPFEQVDGEVVPIGEPSAPEPWESGWKDTVSVGPGEIVRVIARFEDFVGSFPYHCHVLEHEDHEMMRQFVTRTECGDGARGLPDEECDDGNRVDGDGCSASCTLEGEVDGGRPDGGSTGDGGSSARDAGASIDGGTGESDSGGCGCRVVTSRDRDGAGLAILLGLVGLALGRRRRR